VETDKWNNSSISADTKDTEMLSVPGYCALLAAALQRQLEASAILDPTDPEPLLHVVETRIQDQVVRALCDTGATHTFILK
jgi:hypothetical protein